MRAPAFSTAFLVALVCCGLETAAAGSLEERFVINAQYRGAVTKTFKDVGRGSVLFTSDAQGSFGMTIAGSLQNPDTKEELRLNVSAEFAVRGNAIRRLRQKLDLSEEAKRYEQLVTHNLPFVYLARFNPLPKGPDPDEVHYTFEGRSYVLRYMTVEGAVEATLFEMGTMIGKFFLYGDFGKPPKGLQKARMVGANHLIFSLVIDRSKPPTRRGD